MRLLRIIPSIDPSGGGPMEAARKIDHELLNLGHFVEVVCLDDPESEFATSYPCKVTSLGPSLGKYCFNRKLIPWLNLNKIRFDAVIVDGLWQYHAYGAWRSLKSGKIPYFVFTHGMLDPWFKFNKPLKHLKKWIYWPWSDYRLLRDAAGVLFTCDEERQLARKSFWLYKAREIVVSFGTASSPFDASSESIFFDRYRDLVGKRIFLFLGRIHEKKGCDLLIQAFAKVGLEDNELRLVMAGPDQTGWAKRLQALAISLGVEDKITWPGMLTDGMKWGAFYAAEAFCLPSHQENFGIAVAESLACGTPVLISNKVNIWREIEADRAGLVGDDTVDGTVAVFRRWLALSVTERSEMASHALPSFNRRFRIDQVAADLVVTIQAELSKR